MTDLHMFCKSTGFAASAFACLYVVGKLLTQFVMTFISARSYNKLVSVFLTVALLLPADAIENGDEILNKAQLSFLGGGDLANNAVAVLIDAPVVPAQIQFWRASVGAGGGNDLQINDGFCSASGNLQGPFSALDAVQYSPLMGDNPDVELFEANSYNSGDPIFVRVSDALANQDSTLVETIVVTLSVADSNESEVIRLQETAANSGEFVGYIQSVANVASVNDCSLSVFADAQVIAEYTNAQDVTEAVSSTALVDPFGTFFDSQSGIGVNGAVITLVNVATGLPADVFGDGPQFAAYPATVIAGATVEDASGRQYQYGIGQYRFPYVAAGDYRLEVIAPAGYNFPTVLSNEAIVSVRDAVIVVGSRGEDFAVPDGPPKQVDLPADPNPVVTPVDPTPAKIDFLAVINGGGGITYNVNQPQCSLGDVSQPVSIFDQALPLTGSYQLIETTHYKAGEPIFIRVVDADQNRDNTRVEHIVITLDVPESADVEYLSLRETAADSGIFIGYIQSSSGSAGQNDCALSVVSEQLIGVTYTDAFDNTDSVVAQALVDPYGVIFDSATGELIDGIIVSLIDVATGELAKVFGDDGVSDFPASITTGGQAQDGSGAQYQFGPGEYRFPFVQPGEYQIQLQTPALYAYPSTRSNEQLQQLPGAPYEIVAGSRAEVFNVPVGPALRVDVPLDRQKIQLFLTKSSSKSSVAVGEFLQYRVQLSNISGEAGLPNQIDITDQLPLGLRYQPGSSKISQQSINDPSISADGYQLTYAVEGEFAELEQLELSYVVEVTAATPLGEAVNRVTAQGPEVAGANTANASVLVKEDLLRSRATLIGRVIKGSCDGDLTNNLAGLADVRIYFEDGSYVDTDEEGKWHLEGVLPGTHVVQLDTESLPDRYEVHACENNSRFGGTAYSQFVDVQGGSLWRADFYVKEAPAPHGDVVIQQKLELIEGQLFGEILVRNDSPVILEELKLVYRAPKGWQLINGQMDLNGKLMQPKPSIIGLVLELDPFNDHLIRFALEPKIKPAVIDAKALSSAYVRFKASGTAKGIAKPIKLALADIIGLGQVQYASGGNVATDALLKGFQSSLVSDSLNLSSREISGESKGQVSGAWLDEVSSSSTDGVDKATGILGFSDGQSLSNRIASVRLRLDLTLEVQLLLDGELIPQERIGFTMEEPSSQTKLYNFIGVDFGAPGVHELTLQGLGPFGNVRYEQSLSLTVNDEIHRIELIEGASSIADGKSAVKVRFALFDKNDKPLGAGARVLLKQGDLTPYQSQSQRQAEALNNNLVVDGKDKQETKELVIGGDGYARFNPVNNSGRYQITLQANEFEQAFEIYVKPADREWIMVGFAEGSVGYRTLSGHAENSQAADLNDGYYHDGRMAFYAKGSIKGEWLLTTAYDTAKENQDKLFQTIDPQAYYTLYGDNTRQNYDASSASKLYLKIEKEQFSALYGDYSTGLSVTELSKYNRSLTGLKTEYFGDNWRFNGFAALTDQAFLRDDIRGDGTSGLYRLSGQDLLINTEKIRLETRDRFRSQDILSTRRLNRHIDYSIDYNDGTLFFKQPVLSQDEDFNPVYIVVEYETSGEGSGNKNYTGGGRLSYQTQIGEGQQVELGTTVIHEGNENRESDLVGFDMEVKLTQDTKIHAEIARTNAQTDDRSRTGSAYLIELEHRARNIDAKAFVREQQAGFGIGQQAASEKGSRKMGATLAYDLGADNKFAIDISRDSNLETQRNRDVVTIDYTYKGERIRMRGGAKVARDSGGGQAVQQSNLITTGANYSFFKERLDLRLEGEIGLGGKGDNSEHPTRVIIGTDFKMTDWATLYAEQELTFGKQQDTRDTRVGIRSEASPWQGGRLSSSVETVMGEDSQRVFANLGVSQELQLTENGAVDFGMDRSQILRDINGLGATSAGNGVFAQTPSAQGSGSGDFTALYLGADYQDDDWEASSRMEYRHAKTDDKWNLALGAIRELNDGMVVSARFDMRSNQSDVGSDSIDGVLRLSLAYRPLSSKWTVLNRLDLAWNEQSGGDFANRTRKIVNNLNANYKYSANTQMSLQYGAKYVLDNIDKQEFSGFTDLMGFELRHDISEKMDVGARASVLHSWSSDVIDYSYGVSVGYNLMRNTWVSLGYNFDGYQDGDFSAAEYSAQGPYLKFRVKVDQDSIRDLLKDELPQH